MSVKQNAYNFTMRDLWGLAKSKELALTDDELHAIVEGETGKESIKKLTQKEINAVCHQLLERKGIAAEKALKSRRTDIGGNASTIGLRRKIYALCGVLGWNDNNLRIRAFAQKITGVEALEWLTAAQCNKVIEALKKIVEREKDGVKGEGMG